MTSRIEILLIRTVQCRNRRRSKFRLKEESGHAAENTNSSVVSTIFFAGKFSRKYALCSMKTRCFRLVLCDVRAAEFPRYYSLAAMETRAISSKEYSVTFMRPDSNMTPRRSIVRRHCLMFAARGTLPFRCRQRRARKDVAYGVHNLQMEPQGYRVCLYSRLYNLSTVTGMMVRLVNAAFCGTCVGIVCSSSFLVRWHDFRCTSSPATKGRQSLVLDCAGTQCLARCRLGHDKG